jgi:hypothetical protein
MKREYTIDDRIDRLTMRDSIFYEANVAGSGSGMEAEMWDFERRWVKGGVGEEKYEHSVVTLNFASALWCLEE